MKRRFGMMMTLAMVLGAALMTMPAVAQDSQEHQIVIFGGANGQDSNGPVQQEVTVSPDGQVQAVNIRPVGLDAANAKQNFVFLSGVVNGPIVKNAPYSATEVHESVQTLADGNWIVQRTEGKVYRDGQGRERREEGDSVMISDPVGGKNITLHMVSKTANEVARPNTAIFGQFNRSENGAVAVNTTRGIFGGARSVGPAADSRSLYTLGLAPKVVGQSMVFTRAGGSEDVTEDDLGTRTMEGVTAHGTRSTLTIPAGEIGNERPIEVVDERWYSDELETTVMTRHSDPRSGETTFQLTNIQLVEPPPNLFEIPADYSLQSADGQRNGVFILRNTKRNEAVSAASGSTSSNSNTNSNDEEQQ